jgi:hypothetical protein
VLKFLKCFLLSAACLCSHFAFSQGASEERLNKVFNILGNKFSCTFSYSDSAIADHYTNIPKTDAFSKAIRQLSNSTLFDFTILADKTVVVSLKKSVEEKCLQLLDSETTKLLNGISVQTPYQKLLVNERGEIVVQNLNKNLNTLVTATGYTTKNINWGLLENNNCTLVSLEKNIEQLTPIFIDQYITSGIDKNTDGSIAIDFEDFVVLPGLIEKDVLLSLQALPGIQSVNENVSYLNIRGGTNDQNLVLWDGIKMYQNGHFFGLISAFNPSVTNKVRLTRNGTDAKLGDGVSGTIELFTTAKTAKKLRAEAGVNMLSADAFVDVPLGKLASIQIGARKSLNGTWSSPAYNAYFEKAFQNTDVLQDNQGNENSTTDFSFYDTSFRVLIAPTQKDKIRVNFMVLSNELSFLDQFKNEVPLDDSSLSSALSQRTIASGLNYNRIWNGRFDTNLQVYSNNYELKALNGDLLNEQSLLQKNELEETGVTIQNKYSLTKKLLLTAGYEFVETGITNLEQLDNPAFFQEEKKVLRRNSGFASMQFVSINGKTQFKTGIRANHYSKFNTILWEPRLSFNQRISKYFAVELLGEFKSQHTSQTIDLQKDFLGVENRRWVLSNPETDPLLQSKQISAGLSFSRRGFLLNLEPYVKEVKGISSKSQGFQNQFENADATGSYLIKGVDVLVNKKFRDFMLWGNYSYADNRYTFESLDPSAFHNNLDITNTLSAGANYSWNNFDFSLGITWHTGKPFTAPASNSPQEDGSILFAFPNSERIKDYIRADFSALYNFKLSKGISGLAGVSIWNLMNRTNHVRTFFVVSEDNEVQRVNDKALPITPNATIRLFF